MYENTENISDLAEQISFPPYEDFPDLELYMDQVIDILSRSRTSFRNEKLSSAMVNNYIKADILPRANGKKYSREHITQLAVIIRLKQILSVNDTGALIKACKDNKSDEEFFDGFRNLVINNYEEILEKARQTDETSANIAMMLAVQSYVNKVVCEYFIDNLLYDSGKK